LPKSAAERMASLRDRQGRAGLVTLTLVVPRNDAAGLVSWTRRRREEWLKGDVRSRRAVALPRHLGNDTARSALRSEDIQRLRELVEVAAVGLVIARMNPRIERRLRLLVEQGATMNGDSPTQDLQRFHMALGEMSADKTLHFLLRIALHVTAERSAFPLRPRGEREAVVSRIRRFQGLIVDAMIERNDALADRRMRRYLAGLRDWLA
jgi:DNA-binding FadR family transcriptional regulator